MNNVFGTKYPIVCAAMKEVSDFKLACAVRAAGCLPSFFYQTSNDVLKYRNEVDDIFNIFVSFDYYLTDVDIDVILDVKPKMLEVSWFGNIEEILRNPSFKKLIEKSKENGTKIFRRELFPISKLETFLDGVNIKGKESGGSSGIYPTRLNFLKQKQLLPNTPIIATGGIYSPSTVKWYMDNKAELVYIGTPFALTYESSIHNDVKQRLLLMNKSNIETTQLSLLEIDPANRNTVILGKLKNKDNLKYGVKGEGGYIFAGHALDSIDKIVSVHDIVEYMTSSLSF